MRVYVCACVCVCEVEGWEKRAQKQVGILRKAVHTHNTL